MPELAYLSQHLTPTVLRNTTRGIDRFTTGELDWVAAHYDGPVTILTREMCFTAVTLTGAWDTRSGTQLGYRTGGVESSTFLPNVTGLVLHQRATDPPGRGPYWAMRDALRAFERHAIARVRCSIDAADCDYGRWEATPLSRSSAHVTYTPQGPPGRSTCPDLCTWDVWRVGTIDSEIVNARRYKHWRAA